MSQQYIGSGLAGGTSYYSAAASKAMPGCLCLFPLPTFLLRISFTQRPGGLSPAVVCQKWKWRGTLNQQFQVKARNKATRPNTVFALDDDKLRNHGLTFPSNTQSHEISKNFTQGGGQMGSASWHGKLGPCHGDTKNHVLLVVWPWLRPRSQ